MKLQLVYKLKHGVYLDRTLATIKIHAASSPSKGVNLAILTCVAPDLLMCGLTSGSDSGIPGPNSSTHVYYLTYKL